MAKKFTTEKDFDNAILAKKKILDEKKAAFQILDEKAKKVSKENFDTTLTEAIRNHFKLKKALEAKLARIEEIKKQLEAEADEEVIPIAETDDVETKNDELEEEEIKGEPSTPETTEKEEVLKTEPTLSSLEEKIADIEKRRGEELNKLESRHRFEDSLRFVRNNKENAYYQIKPSEIAEISKKGISAAKELLALIPKDNSAKFIEDNIEAITKLSIAIEGSYAGGAGKLISGPNVFDVSSIEQSLSQLEDLIAKNTEEGILLKKQSYENEINAKYDKELADLKNEGKDVSGKEKELAELDKQEQEALTVKEYVPKNVVGSLTIPNKDGSFSERAFTKDAQETASFYQIEDLGNNKFAVFFRDGLDNVRQATSSPELILNPTYKIRNALNQDAKHIVTTKPAIYEKENGKFTLRSVGEMYYEKAELSKADIEKIKAEFTIKRQSVEQKYNTREDQSLQEKIADIEKRRQEEFLKRAKQVGKKDRLQNIIDKNQRGLSEIELAEEYLNQYQAPVGNETYLEFIKKDINPQYDKELEELKKEKGGETGETTKTENHSVSEKLTSTIDYYLSFPNSDGSFNESSARKSVVEGASVYAFQNIGGNKYEVYINQDPSSVKLALQYSDKALDPLFEAISATNLSAKTLQTIEPAVVELENGKFKLISKGKMDFDRVGIERENKQ